MSGADAALFEIVGTELHLESPARASTSRPTRAWTSPSRSTTRRSAPAPNDTDVDDHHRHRRQRGPDRRPRERDATYRRRTPTPAAPSRSPTSSSPTTPSARTPSPRRRRRRAVRDRRRRAPPQGRREPRLRSQPDPRRHRQRRRPGASRPPRTTPTSLTIAVTDVNEAPTVSLAERDHHFAEGHRHQPSAIKVADIVITDDALGTNTLTLSGADAALFEIVGARTSTSKAGARLDFEANPSLDVTVSVNDPAVAPDPERFRLPRHRRHRRQRGSRPSPSRTRPLQQTKEPSPSSTKVADIVITDDALGTNTLTLSGADAALFEIVGGNALHLKAGAAIDFESNPTLDVTVSVNDPAIAPDPNDSDSLAVTVTDQNDQLAAININQTVSFTEDDASAAIADIVISDADAGEEVTATLTLANTAAGSLTTSGAATYSSGTGIWTVTGSVASVNAALAVVSFIPSLNYAENTTISVSVVDGGENGTVPVTGTINLNATAVNDEPGFTLAGNQSVNEDAGAQSVAGFAAFAPGGGSDENGQTATYTATNNNNSLFSTQPGIDVNGILTYTPAANASGTATVTVSVQDNGGTGNGGDDTSGDQTFTITVNSVNDQPGFDITANHTSTENAGAQTASAFATNLNRGAADESGQTLSFHIVGNNNPGLFSSGPAIGSNGTLTYTAADYASGTATIQVNLTDSGGVANGGIDTSVTKAFTITVNPFVIVGTTSVTINENGDLVVEDIDGGSTADRLFVTADGTGVTISDSTQILGTNILGATHPDDHTVIVPFNLFDNLIILTRNGEDHITVNSLTGFNQSLTIDGGGTDGAIDFIDFRATASGATGENFDFKAERIQFSPGSSITATGTGTIFANASGGAGTFQGILLNGATLSSETGEISLTGRGGNSGSLNDGVRIANSSAITSADGTLTITGTAGSSTGINDRNAGVYTNDASLTTTGIGSISVTGNGTSSAHTSIGLSFTATTIAASGTGNITLNGTGGVGSSSNRGIQIGGRTTVTTGSGNLVIEGNGNGTGSQNTGVALLPGSTVVSGGTLSINGAGGAGTSNNSGINVNNATIGTTGSGTLSVFGIASWLATGSYNSGIVLLDSTISGNGVVEFTGNGGGGSNNNTGISATDSNIIALTSFDLRGTADVGTTGKNNIGIQILNSSLSDIGTLLGYGGGNSLSNLSNFGISMQNVLSGLLASNITGYALDPEENLFGNFFNYAPLLPLFMTGVKASNPAPSRRKSEISQKIFQATIDRALAFTSFLPPFPPSDTTLVFRDGGYPPLAAETAALEALLNIPTAGLPHLMGNSGRSSSSVPTALPTAHSGHTSHLTACFILIARRSASATNHHSNISTQLWQIVKVRSSFSKPMPPSHRPGPEPTIRNR